MSWRHLSGPELQVSVTMGATAGTVGEVVTASADTVVAVGDGGLVAGVLHDACDGDATNVQMDKLCPGSVWEATVDTLTANRGIKVAMAGTDAVDAGTTSDPAVGIIVNVAIGATDTKADIYIPGGTPTID